MGESQPAFLLRFGGDSIELTETFLLSFFSQRGAGSRPTEISWFGFSVSRSHPGFQRRDLWYPTLLVPGFRPLDLELVFARL